MGNYFWDSQRQLLEEGSFPLSSNYSKAFRSTERTQAWSLPSSELWRIFAEKPGFYRSSLISRSPNLYSSLSRFKFQAISWGARSSWRGLLSWESLSEGMELVLWTDQGTRPWCRPSWNSLFVRRRLHGQACPNGITIACITDSWMSRLTMSVG